MKRGEIWTLQDKHYASKARPVVVIQSDKHDCTRLYGITGIYGQRKRKPIPIDAAGQTVIGLRGEQ